MEEDKNEAPKVEVAEPKLSKRPVTDRLEEPNPKPKAFDVSGYLKTAEAHARSYFDDAVLFRIDAEGVRPNGLADLSLDDRFNVLYRFISPSDGKRPDDLPKGVEHKPTCIVYVLVDARSISVYTLKGWRCDEETPVRRPKCSAKEVWTRAAAQGAPTDNAVASLTYLFTRGRPGWWHKVGDDSNADVPDDC